MCERLTCLSGRALSQGSAAHGYDLSVQQTPGSAAGDRALFVGLSLVGAVELGFWRQLSPRRSFEDTGWCSSSGAAGTKRRCIAADCVRTTSECRILRRVDAIRRNVTPGLRWNQRRQVRQSPSEVLRPRLRRFTVFRKGAAASDCVCLRWSEVGLCASPSRRMATPAALPARQAAK